VTNEQIEIELKHLATKELLEGLRAALYKVKADLIQVHLTAIGVILVAVGLMIHFKI
jgi:hypothetical protein